MTTLPTRDQIDARVRDLRNAATILELYGATAMRVANDHEVALSASHDGRGPKGEHSDPTAVKAIDERNDGSLGWARDIAGGWQAFPLALNNLVGPIITAGKAAKNTTRTPPVCDNPHGCPDNAYAESGRGGRCYACWRYRKNHDGTDRNERYQRTGQHHSSRPTPDLDLLDSPPDEPKPNRKGRQPQATKTRRPGPAAPRTAVERVAAMRQQMGRA